MEGELEIRWQARLEALCSQLRTAVRGRIEKSLASDGLAELARPLRAGAGDVTFGIDQCAEDALDRWLTDTARHENISLLSEDTGWRHRGPGGGGVRELPDFDHGGPRIAIDPIDGTRHLMSDMRSAWSIVSFAPPGAREPRMADLTLGLVSEIPDSRAARWRSLSAIQGRGGMFHERALDSQALFTERRLGTGSDQRADQGYFAFFRYHPAQRPALAAIEARFFERLAHFEAADVRACYDDQYISSGGQLALVSLGVYRMCADLRAFLGARHPEIPSVPTHPYDLAGAVLVAREAGAVVEAIGGESLDFPIDATTPVSFVAWTNAATRQRLSPHFRSALGSCPA
ncbi:MAG: hypothetical protein ABI054_03695 [Planctomycetota bacterium]